MSYAFSDDEEIFHSPDYETPEQAAEAAPEEMDLEPGDTFWVGKAKKPNGEEWIPDGERVLQWMREELGDSDSGGEWSESWLERVKPEDKAALTEAIRVTVAKWMDDTKNRPGFFTVEDITEHTAPTPTETKEGTP